MKNIGKASIWSILKGNKIFFFCLLYLAVLGVASVFASSLAPYSYEVQNIIDRLQLPSTKHWMGTDSLGRDLFSRVLYGSQISLAIGVFTTLAALFVGLLIGSIAGFYGGWIDSFLMRITDMLLIFPSILSAILLMLLFGRGFWGIFFAVVLTSWLTLARLVRSQVLLAKTLPYVESATAIGASDFEILLRHIFPNILGPIIVALTIQIPTNIMTESFLSFVGLGLEPPYASWGTLANEGFRGMMSYPHLILFPGVVLFGTLLVFNYLGDSLRDFLDLNSS